MSWGFQFPRYVSAGERRAKVAREAQKLNKAGGSLSPVRIEGRTIASTFWGKAWCTHLESYSDYENRLPRGRSYLRDGSVLDLQVTAGRIAAQVMGSSLYRIEITIVPLAKTRWEALKQECSGQIDSLIELLRGRLSAGVMRLITDRERGIFPAPREIRMTCSCPDSASLCKHLAAVLYGVGARLDAEPALLFQLRAADHLELIAGAATAAVPAGGEGAGLDDAALADVFGIEISPAHEPLAGVLQGIPGFGSAGTGAPKPSPRPGAGKVKVKAAPKQSAAGQRNAKRKPKSPKRPPRK